MGEATLSRPAVPLFHKGHVAKQTQRIEDALSRETHVEPIQKRNKREEAGEQTMDAKHTKVQAENVKLRAEVGRLRTHIRSLTTASNTFLEQPFVTLKVLECGSTDDGGHQWQWTCEEAADPNSKPLHVDDPDVTINYWCEATLQAKVKESLSPRPNYKLYTQMDGGADTATTASPTATPNLWVLTIMY